MERVFPIRVSILDDRHVAGNHQQQEIDQQRVTLVDTPKAPERSPAIELPGIDFSTTPIWPPNVSVNNEVDSPPPGDALPQLTYTERCEYAFTDEQGHGVVTGKNARFTLCEDEEIHIPGAVQSHGMLIGLEMTEGTETRYLCRVVSENSELVCKHAPRALLGLDNFLVVVPTHQHSVFQRNAQGVRAGFAKTLKSVEPKVFLTSFLDPEGNLVPAWCAMHFVGGDHKLLVCEFEKQDGFPLEKALSNLPPTPFNSVDSDALDSTSSFLSKSEPLNMDISDIFQGEGRTVEVLNVMSQIQQQLSSQEDIQDLLDVIVGLVKNLTGYHRCMVYRFDEEYNGTVVAELINPQASSDILKGLNFPASDIPKQARELYKINKVRVLFDREQEPSRLIRKTAADLDSPMDLTHSYLRAMSPVHLRYLKNMGVRSTMSVSLDYGNDLWGLICCHSYGPTGIRVSFPVGELCHWVGQCASNCLHKLLNMERIRARNIANTIQLDFGHRTYLSASSEELLRIFKADFGFLVVQGEARTIGRLCSYLEAVTLLRYVYFRNFDSTLASRNITKDFPDLVYEPGFDHIAGLLCIPLSQAIGDFIIFFRASKTIEVHWAGNPNMSKSAKMGHLEPRDSFKRWTETVRGTCQPWTDEQFEAAAMTRLVYGNFIRVWREKEAALQESRMKRLLLVNLSHETLRYALIEMALEKSLDKSTKSILSMSHGATQSLIYVIDDLLNLTGVVKVAPPSVNIAFDLPEGLQHTLDQLRNHALQKFLTFDVIKDINLPRFVFGDLQRLQQAVSSLVTNSIQHTEQGGIIVHLEMLSATEERCVIQISVQDSGVGMSERELDDLFQEFEQVPNEDTISVTSSTEEEKGSSSKTTGRKSKLGLGLALLARYIKLSGGQIRGKSSPGKGSTFSFEVPLKLSHEVPDYAKPMYCTPATSQRLDTGSEHSTASPRRPILKSINFPQSVSKLQQITNPETESLVIASSQTEEVPIKGNLAILLADDNFLNLAILQTRLKKMGHKVQLSRDGQQCFEMYQKNRDELDFVLMDIHMPFVDGIEATKMIRALEAATTHSSTTTYSPAFRSPRRRFRRPPNPSAPKSSLHTGSGGTSEAVSPSSIISPERLMFLSSSDPLDVLLRAHKSFSSLAPNSPRLPESEPPYLAQLSSQETRGSYCPNGLISSIEQPNASSSQGVSSVLSYRSSSLLLCAAKRIPIFAISASLDQYSQESLEEAGFDGWLTKPIDFRRLSAVLEGTTRKASREKVSYQSDDFRVGGWFR